MESKRFVIAGASEPIIMNLNPAPIRVSDKRSGEDSLRDLARAHPARPVIHLCVQQCYPSH